ncbi:unnamed protein product [Caenorhabditis sp. 36 PRJEB53466]|nr:unnamed protein product [Caenorhabditis sp. 36 PRJEB53466]
MTGKFFFPAAIRNQSESSNRPPMNRPLPPQIIPILPLAHNVPESRRTAQSGLHKATKKIEMHMREKKQIVEQFNKEKEKRREAVQGLLAWKKKCLKKGDELKNIKRELKVTQELLKALNELSESKKIIREQKRQLKEHEEGSCKKPKL